MSMYYTDNPVRDLDRFQRAEARAAARRPKCCVCGEAIWEDGSLMLNGRRYCEECKDVFLSKIESDYWEAIL